MAWKEGTCVLCVCDGKEICRERKAHMEFINLVHRKFRSTPTDARIDPKPQLFHIKPFAKQLL